MAWKFRPPNKGFGFAFLAEPMPHRYVLPVEAGHRLRVICESYHPSLKRGGTVGIVGRIFAAWIAVSAALFEFWHPEWGNNWDGGVCHDDFHRDMDGNDHTRDRRPQRAFGQP